MAEFGIDKHYFLDLQFLNERNSIPFALIYITTFIVFGGWISFLISTFFGLIITILLQRFLFNVRQPLPTKGLIVITGCSSGLGKRAALEYAHAGLTVAATVRKEEDGKVLQSSLSSDAKGKIIPIICDINQSDQVSRATATIRNFCSQNPQVPFLGLINNAGYSQCNFVELATQQELMDQFNTNVFNLIAFTNAMLPLLRQFGSNMLPKLRPKIINVSSVLARFTLPSNGLYAASKASLESITEVLRQEVAGMGIDVCCVSPGPVATNFLANLSKSRHIIESEDDNATRPSFSTKTFSKEDFDKARKLGNNMSIDDDSAKLHYYSDAQTYLMEKERRTTQFACDPDAVVDIFTEILCSPSPLAHYFAGPQAHVLVFFTRWLWPAYLSIVPIFKSFSTYTNPNVTVTQPKSAPISNDIPSPAQPIAVISKPIEKPAPQVEDVEPSVSAPESSPNHQLSPSPLSAQSESDLPATLATIEIIQETTSQITPIIAPSSEIPTLEPPTPLTAPIFIPPSEESPLDPPAARLPPPPPRKFSEVNLAHLPPPPRKLSETNLAPPSSSSQPQINAHSAPSTSSQKHLPPPPRPQTEQIPQISSIAPRRSISRDFDIEPLPRQSPALSTRPLPIIHEQPYKHLPPPPPPSNQSNLSNLSNLSNPFPAQPASESTSASSLLKIAPPPPLPGSTTTIPTTAAVPIAPRAPKEPVYFIPPPEDNIL